MTNTHQTTQSNLSEGSVAFILIALALGAMTIALLYSGGWETAAIRLAIRSTARTSLGLFLLAFSASSLAKILPSRKTLWLLRNRRWLGLSFAFSHLLHAGVVFLFYRNAPDLFWFLEKPLNFTVGLIGYVFVVTLAATSFNGAVQRLGLFVWRRIHTVGVWVIWTIFFLSTLGRIPRSAYYIFPVVLLVCAVLLRIVARKIVVNGQGGILIPDGYDPVVPQTIYRSRRENK